MKLLRMLTVVVSLAAVAALLVVGAPVLHGQRGDQGPAAVYSPFGPRSTIGASVRDVESSPANRQPAPSGVVIDDVRPDSPAQRAGLEKADVVTEFDGERVRSARQFARLVEETPAGRTVHATVLRDGQRRDVQITPESGRRAEISIDPDRFRADIDELARQMPRFDFDVPVAGSRGRLGVTFDDLTPQLASYFGVKEGVLVTSVSENSPASRAGLRAGDVITAINDRPVRASADLTRAVRDVEDGEVTIAIVRDKKESTVKAQLEPARRPRRRSPVVDRR